jgi:hypothetical protein
MALGDHSHPNIVHKNQVWADLNPSSDSDSMLPIWSLVGRADGRDGDF